ncbi:glutamate 5-kinase [Brevundimonas sp. M20]|uniref:glutamate 5-kinase n=1 Tax=Brevundimonas sp. M20 TaxID=2591463 RepID=UPI0011479737|nr:glutamate 5-kinase [Brevundimonas sp. M20]QDH72447.1 glutamate 5-kinase [Brevundimonas sp. M20]
MTSSAASALAASRRLVLKVGSALLIDGGRPNGPRLAALGQEIADLRARGVEVIVVSSGAVALGRGRLGISKSARLDEKQAAAAAGQSLLMQAWEAALSPHGLTPAQVLLTRDDTERRRRWLNARSTLDALLRLKAVPVVNENDTVATEEIRYGDNDRLAARTAQLARADLLVLLSDIDGLYDADPRSHPDAAHLPLVEALTPEVMAMAGEANASASVGTGGMRTKLEAARIARSAGCATVIASGLTDRPLAAVLDGAKATLIPAPDGPMAAWKSWIAGSVDPAGRLVVDAGAVAALRAGKSLLPSGVQRIEGRFDRGDSVLVVTPDGARAAVGLAAFSAEEMALIRGRQTGEIEGLVGYKGPQVAIHRDDLVLEGAA